jgi:hypothetical protein
MILKSLIYLGVYALLITGAGLALWGWLQVRSFLKIHDSIRSQMELDEFKRVAKTNMFLALAIIVIVGLILLLGSAGLFFGVFGWIDLLVVFLVLGPLCSFAGFKLTTSEGQMKAITVEDETLREEFDHVVRRWTSSAFPDW